jgi:hypothetical protein
MKALFPERETLRLFLRPLALADAEQVQPLFGQWEIVKHLASVVPWSFPPDGASIYYRAVARFPGFGQTTGSRCFF